MHHLIISGAGLAAFKERLRIHVYLWGWGNYRSRNKCELPVNTSCDPGFKVWQRKLAAGSYIERFRYGRRNWQLGAASRGSTQEDGMYVRYCTKPYTRFEFKIELLT